MVHAPECDGASGSNLAFFTETPRGVAVRCKENPGETFSLRQKKVCEGVER